ncbi:unnamed protein product [Orchesella dallaii]|uniref:Uncharacterized protein n=1 Tax=Orchesella dallaii TaxID=48710 RepID=A0ABP1R607_9HEXA
MFGNVEPDGLKGPAPVKAPGKDEQEGCKALLKKALEPVQPQVEVSQEGLAENGPSAPQKKQQGGTGTGNADEAGGNLQSASIEAVDPTCNSACSSSKLRLYANYDFGNFNSNKV